MSEYTKGPWRISFGGGEHQTYPYQVIGPNGELITSWGSISRKASANGQANARLIAAAPELLEALHECRRVMLVEESLRPGYGWADHVSRHVDPAIAKATGGQP